MSQAARDTIGAATAEAIAGGAILLPAGSSSRKGREFVKGRTRWIVLTVVIAAVLVVAVWVMLRHFRRDAGALLELLPPDADAVVVLDLDLLQSNPAVKKLFAGPSNASLSPEYQQLLAQTGFRFQDDLRQLAAAKLGPDWVGTARVDVDRPRFLSYLKSQGALESELAGRTVYSFGSERPFRLAFLEDRLVAFAVGADPGNLTRLVDRYANRSGGSAKDELGRSGLLERYPAGSGLWFVGRTERLFESDPAGPSLGPFQFGKDWWQGSRIVIASVVSSPLHLDIHLESQCDNAASAERMANAFRAVLAILRAVPPSQSESKGPDYAPLLAAVAIRQAEASVFIDWHWDASMLAMLAEGTR